MNKTASPFLKHDKKRKEENFISRRQKMICDKLVITSQMRKDLGTTSWKASVLTLLSKDIGKRSCYSQALTLRHNVQISPCVWFSQGRSIEVVRTQSHQKYKLLSSKDKGCSTEYEAGWEESGTSGMWGITWYRKASTAHCERYKQFFQYNLMPIMHCPTAGLCKR